jgi:Protein of unknown function (DUF2442)
MKRLVRVRSVTPLTGFTVRLEFSDGSARDVDLEKYLRGPIFDPLRTDPARFREVHIESGAGTICWPNGADIDPDVLYHNLEPAWTEDDSSRPAVGSVA